MPDPPRSATVVRTVDYHTAGEPFRIVEDPVPVGADVAARRRDAVDRLDDVRRLLTHEPRGHADMYGGFVTPPDDDGADLGVVFFHADGFSTACGHGTIALVTWALEEGRVPVTGPVTRVVVDVPSGRVTCEADVVDGVVTGVRFHNVGAYVAARDLTVELDGRQVQVDVAYGGAFYVVVPAAAVGVTADDADLPGLVALGRALQQAVDAAGVLRHAGRDDLAGIYGVVFVDEDPDGSTTGRLRQRNVTVFGDGQVDRSPTGSATSARLALLEAQGRLPRGDVLVNVGVTGEAFEGRVLGDVEDDGRAAVATEVTGAAWLTGRHEFVLDPDDPLGHGFHLR